MARTRPVERTAAAVALALPLLYLVTDRSVDPVVWRYSLRLLAAIILYATAAGLFLWTYTREVSRRFDRWRSLAAASIVAVVGGLAATELLLRAVDPFPYRELPNVGQHMFDPDVGHIYFPNHRQTLQTREWRQEWRSNAQGVRADRDFGPKPEGTKRILVIGDSFTVGDQVPPDSTYPGVLERLLRERYGPDAVEIVNAGFPGYGTVHEARWLAKFGAQFEPDLVVLGMTPNDLVENRVPLRVIAHEGALIRAARRDWFEAVSERRRWWSLPGLVERSMIMEAIRNARRRSRPYAHHPAFAVQPDSTAESLFELAEGYLLDAREAAHELGARFAFITIPFREQLGEMGPGRDPEAFARRWRKFAEARGIPFEDVLPAFQAHPRPQALYWVKDGHCTAAGYEVIGRTLFDFLVRNERELGLAEDEAVG